MGLAWKMLLESEMVTWLGSAGVSSQGRLGNGYGLGLKVAMWLGLEMSLDGDGFGVGMGRRWSGRNLGGGDGVKTGFGAGYGLELGERLGLEKPWSLG